MPYTDEHQIYVDALLVQNACNLSGVVGSLKEALSFMTFELKLDERAKRSHPVTCAFLFKIADMTDLNDCNSEYLYAKLKDCEKWIKEHGHEVPNY